MRYVVFFFGLPIGIGSGILPSCQPINGSQSTTLGGPSPVSMGKEMMKGDGRKTFTEVVARAVQLQECPLVPSVTVERVPRTLGHARIIVFEPQAHI